MPEGPEVRRVTDKLRASLKGSLLLLLKIQPGNKYSTPLSTDWSQVEYLFPSTCLDIICRGKQIFFFFENQVAFISGLGMEGHWYNFPEYQRLVDYITGTNYSRFCLRFGIVRHNMFITQNDLWYDDMLSFGNFTVTNWAGAIDKMGKIGPDLLATVNPIPDIHPIVERILPPIFKCKVTLPIITTEIRNSRRVNMTICQFLMKQEYLSGIGNYLKSEILYRSKIHPFRKLDTLTDNELYRLHSTTLHTISHAYQCGGLTHGTFLDPDMEKGNFPIYIYKKAGELDPNGHRILFVSAKDSPDKRGTYYVAEEQPI